MNEEKEKLVERVCELSDNLTGASLRTLPPRETALAMLAGLCGALEDYSGQTPAEVLETVQEVLVAIRTGFEQTYPEGVNRERPN